MLLEGTNEYEVPIEEQHVKTEAVVSERHSKREIEDEKHIDVVVLEVAETKPVVSDRKSKKSHVKKNTLQEEC